jgi:hypothetical protein
MPKFEKFNAHKRISGLRDAAKLIKAEEAREPERIFLPSYPNIVSKLPQLKLLVTIESYSQLAHWKSLSERNREEQTSGKRFIGGMFNEEKFDLGAICKQDCPRFE